MKNIIYSVFIFAAILAITGCTNSRSDIITFNNPALPYSTFPSLFSTGDQVYMSWITHHPENENYSLNYARFSQPNGWSDVYTIAESSSWFVNWADFPSIIADKQGAVAAHWLYKIPGGTYAYNVNISLINSNDEWTLPITPHLDSTATEHGFVSMIPWNEDTILAVWLDGRQSANSSEDEYYDLANAMTLRGALISTSGKVKKSFLIDDSVCDCCQTSLIKTEKGALVAYRNRTDEEIRDIYISRFDGNDWSQPQTVYNDNWKISACPVNGPKLAARGSLVVLAWPTALDGQLMVKASISKDGGLHFDEPRLISDSGSLGRVDAAIYNKNVFVSWMQKVNDEVYLKLKRLGRQETAPKTITVSKINGLRQTGFPQLEVLDDQLIMAWTDIDAISEIKTIKIDFPKEN